METVAPYLALLSPEGLWGRLAFLAFVWVVAANLGHQVNGIFLLGRFSRAGPVIPLLLPDLENRWDRAFFRIRVWTWLRRMGLVALLVALIGALVDLGLYSHSTMASGLVSPDWRQEVAAHLARVNGVAVLLALGFAVRLFVGGLSLLVLTRARNYVSASSSLVSASDIARARRYLNEVQQYETDGGGDGEE